MSYMHFVYSFFRIGFTIACFKDEDTRMERNIINIKNKLSNLIYGTC